MPPSKRVPADIRGTITYRLITLETEIANIQYLLEQTGITEAQRGRLHSLLVAVEEERRAIFPQLDGL